MTPGALAAAAATTAWCASTIPAWWRYRRALHAPAPVQERLLLRYVSRNADTVFGRAHGFGRIRTVGDFRERVPVLRYDDYEPFVRRIGRGEPRVLTMEAVTRLAITSGSTSPAKLIPYTPSLHAEYSRAVAPWVLDLYSAYPRLAGGPAYWSITPRLDVAPRAGDAVPVGFEEDSRYLGAMAHRLIDAAMAVPSIVRELPDHDTHRYVTLFFLLRARGLRLISVWHPSYLSLLLAAMRTHWDSLLADIRRGSLTTPTRIPATVAAALGSRLRADGPRAAELAVAGPEAVRRIWPALGVVSCWGDAAARGGLENLRRTLPHVVVQPKGLLATEAVITLPFDEGRWRSRGQPQGPAGTTEPQRRPLAIRSHFFEFADDTGRTWLAHELDAGARYEVIVTTGGGLYRYRLGDRVLVDGFVGRTPSLSFLGRESRVCDVVGEKLHETFVWTVIGGLFEPGTEPRFAMLAPDRQAAVPSYTLFVDCDGSLPAGLPDRLETALRKNPHYALAAGLGQLAPARVVRVRDGFRTFADRSVARGRRLGDVKPALLDLEGGWSGIFTPVDEPEPGTGAHA